MEKFSAFRVSGTPISSGFSVHEGSRIQGLAYRCVQTKLARDSKGAQKNPLSKPFLTPAFTSGNELARKALLPLGIIIGVARVLVVVGVGFLYFLLDSTLSVLSVSFPSTYNKRVDSCQPGRLYPPYES